MHNYTQTLSLSFAEPFHKVYEATMNLPEATYCTLGHFNCQHVDSILYCVCVALYSPWLSAHMHIATCTLYIVWNKCKNLLIVMYM